MAVGLEAGCDVAPVPATFGSEHPPFAEGGAGGRLTATAGEAPETHAQKVVHPGLPACRISASHVYVSTSDGGRRVALRSALTEGESVLY